MILLQRNKKTFFYALYEGAEDTRDENGNLTLEKTFKYGPPIKARGCFVSSSGEEARNVFGTFQDYDKMIILEDPHCPIDENAVLFVDRTPIYGKNGTPQHNYIVRRIVQTLNFTFIAISTVGSKCV